LDYLISISLINTGPFHTISASVQSSFLALTTVPKSFEAQRERIRGDTGLRCKGANSDYKSRRTPHQLFFLKILFVEPLMNIFIVFG
jgi:hypothetical protein